MYLFDTNTSIHYLKHEYGIPFRVSQVGYLNCFLSELVLLEIRYGVANSLTTRKAENYQQLQRLETEFADRILLIRPAFEASPNNRPGFAGRAASSPILTYSSATRRWFMI